MLSKIWEYITRLFRSGRPVAVPQQRSTRSRRRGMTARERAAYELDKGMATAPSHLNREDQISWVVRSRRSDYWKGYDYN